jgi:hypothetical protein
MAGLYAPAVRRVTRVTAAFSSDERGSILLETALAVSAILMVALPFANLVGFATVSARDLSDAHAAARRSVQAKAVVPSPGVEFLCGSAPDAVIQPCPLTLARGTYVLAAKDTVVSFPFGLEFHTRTQAIARV